MACYWWDNRINFYLINDKNLYPTIEAVALHCWAYEFLRYKEWMDKRKLSRLPRLQDSMIQAK